MQRLQIQMVKKASQDGYRKRSKQQIIDDRAKIADMFLKSYSHRQITEQLNAQNPYSLSAQQILRDIHVIISDWKTSTSALIDERMEQDLMKLEKIENEAWEAWDRSRGKKITKTATESDGVKTKQIKEEQLIGEPKFLDLIRQVLQDRANLLGYMAPKKVDTSVSISVTNKIAEMGPDAIQKEIKRLRLVNQN